MQPSPIITFLLIELLRPIMQFFPTITEPPTLAQAAPAKAQRAKQKARLKDPYASDDSGSRALRIARPRNAKVSRPSVNTGGGMGVNTGTQK